jgi:hypothetical protein
MLVDVGRLFGDSSCGGYIYNDLAEQDIAGRLAALIGAVASDFSPGVARPEFDFTIDGMPVELKMTNGIYLPVEVAKDEARTIPSGLAASTAPVTIFISNGHGEKQLGSPPVAKMRAFLTKECLKQIRGTPPSFFRKPKESECALVFFMTGKTVDGRKSAFFSNDMWLGDMEYVPNADGETWSIDTDTFKPSHKAAGYLRWLIQGYRDGDIE